MNKTAAGFIFRNVKSGYTRVGLTSEWGDEQLERSAIIFKSATNLLVYNKLAVTEYNTSVENYITKVVVFMTLFPENKTRDIYSSFITKLGQHKDLSNSTLVVRYRGTREVGEFSEDSYTLFILHENNCFPTGYHNIGNVEVSRRRQVSGTLEELIQAMTIKINLLGVELEPVNKKEFGFTEYFRNKV